MPKGTTFFSISVFGVFLALSACGEKDAPAPMSDAVLEPRVEESVEAGGESPVWDDSRVTEPLPVLDPGSGYRIIKLLDVNLDDDATDEQIIVALPILDPEELLAIYIADYSVSRQGFVVGWKGSLSSRTLSAISLITEDLTGNGKEEIIVSGFDEEGRHVMDVFAQPLRGYVLSHQPIFNLSVDGNIEIDLVNRPPAYWMGQSEGEPNPIIVQEHDPDPEKELDLLETVWSYDTAVDLFRPGPTVPIPGEEIQEERLRALYGGNEKAFEEFLSGSWYRESGDDNVEDIVFFNPVTREIIFFDGTIQEIYGWTSSHRTIAKRLYVQGYSKIIGSLRSDLSLTAEEYDVLELRMHGNAAWNGTYRRLGPALQHLLDRQSSLSGLVSELPLSGAWRSPGGTELHFDLPEVVLREGERERFGTASLFAIRGTEVLQVQFLKRNLVPEETLNWAVDYEEDRDETRVIRSLTLTPVQLSVDGIRKSSSPWRRFEQIEVISTNPADQPGTAG